MGVVFGAETGFQLESDPDTVRAADASFVSRERVAEIGVPNEFWPGPPDVAFEVTSPRDRRGEVESKTRSWLQAGTRAVVVVDPGRRTAVVHRPRGGSAVITAGRSLDLDDVLPGFSPPLEDLFA